MQLTIDGRTVRVRPGSTLLQAAREYGIRIPTLCSHEALIPYGACRLCLVELASERGSRLVASCSYPCEENLNVRTGSDLVNRARRGVVELLMVTGAQLPTVRALADEIGIQAPYVELEPSDCILCGLCVRACREIVGVGAISLTKRGMDRTVSTPFQIASADCIECGTCALVCPTGAIRIEDVTKPIRTSHRWSSAYTRRACRLCEYDPPGPPFPESYEDLLRMRGAAGDVTPTEKDHVG
jgi:bidirectional [NiFe] hydrogenase diaphorase subunit